MREILFRGKRVDNGDWVEGSYINSVVKNGVFGYIAGNNVINPKKIYKKTLGQYTGLTDKNGTKIFDGDIVKYHKETYTSMKDTIGIVEYYNGSYGISYENNQHFLEFSSMSMYVRWYEVIGNIYDNPELLEEKQDER